MMISRRALLLSALAAGLPPAARADELFPVRMDAWKKLPYSHQRRKLACETAEPAGTIVVDPGKCHLYLVLGDGQALRYGVSVGRGAHAWTGEAAIRKMKEWPVWFPTPYHVKAYPSYAKWLPDGMPGGPDNPMGARSMYLFKGEVDTVNRIHGAMKHDHIGKKKTAGCIGMLDCDVIDLYSRVEIGTRVVMRAKRGLFG